MVYIVARMMRAAQQHSCTTTWTGHLTHKHHTKARILRTIVMSAPLKTTTFETAEARPPPVRKSLEGKQDLVSGNTINEHPKTGDQPKQKRSWRFWLVFATLCLISIISAIDSTIVTVALPTMTRKIGERKTTSGWLTSSSLQRPQHSLFSGRFLTSSGVAILRSLPSPSSPLGAAAWQCPLIHT
jgi:hypothetical protein